MQRYRKRPVVIEAVQSTGTPDNNRAIIEWTRGSKTPASMDMRILPGAMSIKRDEGPTNVGVDSRPQLTIATLEGSMWVDHGDWVIKGVNGEFYPCKPDIAKSYKAVAL